MPSRPKKTTSKLSKKKTKNTTNPIHYSSPTLQLQELGGCETASVTCQNQFGDRNSADLSQMEDSSNGKLEETHKDYVDDVAAEEVIESVREIAIEKNDSISSSSSSSSSSSDGEEEAGEKISPEVVVDSEEPKQVSVPVAETVELVSSENFEEGVVEDLEFKAGEEKFVPSLAEIDESSPAVIDETEKQIEETTLPALIDESLLVVTTDVESKGVEETEVVCVQETIEVPPPAPPAVEQVVVSKGIEETKLPVGESSAAEVAPPPVESADAAEVPESAAKPSIVSVTRSPLHPSSWKSCCGLFQVLHRSDR